MKVNSIMTTDVAFCKGNTKLDEAARLMADYNCSGLPVIDDEKSRHVIGILTERDIVRKTLAKGKNPAGLTASSCMTTDVFVAKQDSEIEECLKTMEQHHVRRIPIVDDKRACCGIVTLTNIAEFLPAPTVGEVLKEITEPNRRHNGHKPAAGLSPGQQSSRSASSPAFAGTLGTLHDLPKGVREELPTHAQQVFLESYNGAMREFDNPATRHKAPNEPEQAATKIAWSAVRQKYQKKGDQWVAKSSSTRD